MILRPVFILRVCDKSTRAGSGDKEAGAMIDGISSGFVVYGVRDIDFKIEINVLAICTRLLPCRGRSLA
jgi:hypothetical protein